MENLSKILTGLSHYTYYDQPPFTVKFALSELSGHTPLIEEIRKIAEEKNETTQGRIAAAHKIIFEVHEMPSLQFTPFTKVEKNDIHAYIHYETALFYRNVHDYAASLNHLKIAKLMVECPDIELLIDYQFATVDAETKSSTDQLLNFARIFNQKKMPVMEIMAQFRIGEILASNSDFTGSRKVFTDVQDLIRAIPSQNLLITAISNLGFVYYLEQKYDQALHIFSSIEDCQDYYQKSLILENIALVHEALNNYPTALNYWMDSLNSCQDHGVPVNIPEDSLRIGEIYEKHMGQPSQAKFFYKLGYDHSMQMFRDGINISGYMKKVIDKYISYFTDNYIPDEKPAERLGDKDPFGFALNRTWVEVKNLFNYNLIVFHKFESNSINDMLDVLKLKRSNFQAKQQKLTGLGFHIPDFRKNAYNMDQSNIIDSLQSYIKKNKTMDWKSFNQKFENDILKYFLEEYGTKKEVLVRKLKISYPSLSLKLKRIQSL